MSVKAIDWAFEQKIKSPGQKLVLVALANFADDKGHCFPSYATVGKISGQSERTVMRHMASLEEAGLVSRQRRRRKDGSLGTYNIILRLKTYMTKWPVDKLTSGQNRQDLPDKMASLNPSVEPSVSKEDRRARDLDAFELDEIDRRWAREKAPDADPDTMLETLRDYCAAHGKQYRDYRAAWRNFMKSEQNDGRKRRGNSGRASNPHQTLHDGFAAAAAYFGEGEGRSEPPDDRPDNPPGGTGLPGGHGVADETGGHATDNGADRGSDGPLLDAPDAGESTEGGSGGLGPRVERTAVECRGRDSPGMGENEGAPPDARGISQTLGTVH